MGPFIYYVSIFLGFLEPPSPLPTSAYVIYEWFLSDDMPVEDRSTTWGYAGTDFATNTDVVLSFSVSF